MAGGEFRLGTHSIYMADDGHILPESTSPESRITWLRLRRKVPHSPAFPATYDLRKKEARASLCRERQQGADRARRGRSQGAQRDCHAVPQFRRGLVIAEP